MRHCQPQTTTLNQNSILCVYTVCSFFIVEFDYFLIPWQHPKSLYTLLQDPLSFRMENHTDSTSPVTIATCQSGDDSQVWLIAVGHRNGAVHLWTTDIQGRYEYHHSLLDNTSAISAIAVTSRQYMVCLLDPITVLLGHQFDRDVHFVRHLVTG